MMICDRLGHRLGLVSLCDESRRFFSAEAFIDGISADSLVMMVYEEY